MINIDKPQQANQLFEKLESYWPLLLWLLFGLTVLLRLVNLSQIPISAEESELALLAARIAKGQAGLASDLPVYTGLTASLFFIFSNANFWSRILPIIVGSSLVFLPNFWKDSLDFKRILLLSLAFALIPTVTYFARTIASPIFATAALLWLITLLRLRRWLCAGIAAAFLWLSGSFALPLFAIALIGLFIARSISVNADQSELDFPIEKTVATKFGPAFLVTLVLISTSFFINPAGLANVGTFFTTASQIFRYWQRDELIRATFLLLIYAFIPLLLHVMAWIKFGTSSEEAKSTQITGLTLGSLCLVLSFVNPGFLLPFSILTIAIAVKDFKLEDKPVDQKRIILLPLVVFGTALLIYVNIVAKTWADASYNALALGLATGAGILLYALAHAFVGMGWSLKLAKRAAFTSLAVILVAGTLSSTFRLVLAEPEKSALHWQQTSIYPDSVINPLLVEFQRLADFKAGELLFRADIVPAAPYEWITRELSGLAESPKGASPQVIITTTDKPGSSIENSYRGMALTSAEKIDWRIVDLKHFVVGLFSGDLPLTKIQSYLWVEKFFFSGK